MAENSGFPLDDLMDDLETPEPRDDWEKEQQERKKQGAKLLARAILAGGTESEDKIVESIMKFQDLSRIIREM